MNSPRSLSNGSENHGHGQSAGEAEKKKNEKGIRFLSELGHEVEGDVEADRRENFAGEIADGG